MPPAEADLDHQRRPTPEQRFEIQLALLVTQAKAREDLFEPTGLGLGHAATTNHVALDTTLAGDGFIGNGRGRWRAFGLHALGLRALVLHTFLLRVVSGSRSGRVVLRLGSLVSHGVVLVFA